MLNARLSNQNGRDKQMKPHSEVIGIIFPLSDSHRKRVLFAVIYAKLREIHQYPFPNLKVEKVIL